MYQRERGGVNAAYDLVHRAVHPLGPGQVDAILRSGMIPPGIALTTLEQAMPRVALRDFAGVLAGAARAWRLAAPLAPVVPRMLAVRAAYGHYPRLPDDERLMQWSRVTARLAGWTPDLEGADP
jgi:hypothetical protein